MMNILRDIGMRCEDIWPPAVDIQQFSPSYYDHDLRSKFTFGNPDKPLVIYIGRVAPEKNMDALNRILERFPDAYLAIIGKGPDAPKWARLHGKENRIFCTNAHYHGETLSKAFAVADVFVLPSEFETLGNVVLESMASGVPVVGCNAGGIPHMLSNEKTGLLFEPGDLDGMCEAVGRIIYDRELRERFKQAGLEYTSNKSWRHASEYVVALYEKCIRRHGKLVPGVNAPPEPVYDVGPIFVDPMIGVAPRPGSEGARIDALASAGTASTVVDTRSGGPFGMRSMLPWLLSVMFGVLVFVFVRFNQASNNP
ncbi:hypothetical protein H696_00361 [Fonticula alba]|uniref:Glycosyl transferase family 1 domain-containing protein n=1 Tax=Fonticula alba TaxID=691883 RepID=A0A058ZH22_FONAL|nr:hypothetical protein H696_00361 [Fonticula alba]KCV72782.1 hypothetical protein H696_00361 [Fonticula alba]|eukprot:XP_009492483.1 hypothetical protein H696_00361 [Fonticula alba]